MPSLFARVGRVLGPGLPDDAVLRPVHAFFEHRFRVQPDVSLDDGAFEMKVPYVNETELVMDVLRHGGSVCVVGPKPLVDAVNEQLRAALEAASTYGSSH